MAKATTFPADDDPGWYTADVWDCAKCGLKRISPECKTCLVCDAPQPEGSVYQGECWGMKLASDPKIKLSDLPRRNLIQGPRDQSLADIREIKDHAFFDRMRKFQGEEDD